MNPGEIWLTNFQPSVGHEYQKKRPAIIISSQKAIKRWNLITVVSLTSLVEKKKQGDILINKNNKNNLHKNSLVKVGNIEVL